MRRPPEELDRAYRLAGELGTITAVEACAEYRALIDAAAHDRIDRRVVARIEGGKRMTAAKLIVPVTPDRDACCATRDGPVASMFGARDEAHGIKLANGTRCGVSGVVFTTHVRHGLKVSKNKETGMTSIRVPAVGDEGPIPCFDARPVGCGQHDGSAAISAHAELHRIPAEGWHQSGPT